MADGRSFEFIDVGCSKGASLAWAEGTFGGRGLGVDINADKVARSRAAGRDAMVGDARSLPYPENQFRFGTFIDVLEHLPSATVGEQCIREVYRVVREFVVIDGPNFDDEGELRDQGFKRFHADWSGHVWHHTRRQFLKIARGLKAPRTLILHHGRIRDSYHYFLHPLASPAEQGPYDPGIHPPKPFKVFDRAYHARISMIIGKDPSVNLEAIALKLARVRVVEERAEA